MPSNNSSIPYDVYFDILRNVFQTDVKFSNEEWIAVKKNLKFVSLSKNTIVTNPGQIETVGRFLIDGVVKTVFHGEETYVENFLTDKDFVCDAYSFFERVPSKYSIETITDCVWIETVNLRRLIEDNNKIQMLFLKYISRYLQKSYDYNKQIRKQTAKEQYIQYCKTYPKVVKYAKVSDLASYFGIKLQSLSRIRKEITGG